MYVSIATVTLPTRLNQVLSLESDFGMWARNERVRVVQPRLRTLTYSLFFCPANFGTVVNVGACCRVVYFEVVENGCSNASTFTIPWLLQTTNTTAL